MLWRGGGEFRRRKNDLPQARDRAAGNGFRNVEMPPRPRVRHPAYTGGFQFTRAVMGDEGLKLNFLSADEALTGKVDGYEVWLLELFQLVSEHLRVAPHVQQ